MSRRQIRGGQKISKPRARRQEHRKFLVVTEGTRTEPQYFENLAALLNAKAVQVVKVKPVGIGRDPASVVKEAERRRRQERKGGDPFDEVWCVVDVDQHETLPRACKEARDLGIEMAISSPCFEIWLLWHFENRTRWIDAGELKRLLGKQGFADKNVPENFPYGAHALAAERSATCEPIVHPHMPPNPSSSVASLVASLVRARGDGRTS
ncbi:RloB-like protein [Streptomyces sp. TverLS-915]|uniref:RloB family protein n=1 Tax=Streptomyces sp. TverLS-915 TaxID=1839763 RepID=UPI00081ED9F1|nr:RloB family protein [Streptomyces sp. TverLS-915]SCD36699.1 RloB-like protein [Streptomyces sp. TverLS-915]